MSLYWDIGRVIENYYFDRLWENNMENIEKSNVEKRYDLLHEIECSELQVLKAIEVLQGYIKDGSSKADPRWVAIATTNLEQGYMALLRAFKEVHAG